jgi:hypothetical protein
MSRPFEYALLLPAGTAGAEARNGPLLGANTLGIEVTEAALAARCGLGNIDPQHGSAAIGSPLSAIEVALTCPLPSREARLVTIRPDLDALGAMALLTMRTDGTDVPDDVVARVRAAGRADRFDYGPWPGPRVVPDSLTGILHALGEGEIGAIAAACADEKLPVAERVAVAGEWLRTGDAPSDYVAAARERDAAVWSALERGESTVEPAGPGLAVVKSAVNDTLRLGYFIAPVVVARNPQHAFQTSPEQPLLGRKYTVAQWGIGYADLNAAAAELNALEPGWGGSSTIKGSPQGVPSRLGLDSVLAVVRRNMTDPDRQA